MVDMLLYPRELIAERIVFTPADHAQIALCRVVYLYPADNSVA